MPLLCKILAFCPFDQEPHPNGPNAGFARRAGTPIIVGPAAQLPCLLHSWRTWTVHSEMCQRALGLQSNPARLIARVRMQEQSNKKPTGFFYGDRQSGGRNERFDCHSQDVERFRVFDGATESRGHSTVDGKIKAARCGAVGWRKSAERSGTSHNVRTDTTVCRFAQVPVKSTLRAHCVHPRHDPRR
jgi:hypothetical protein